MTFGGYRTLTLTSAVALSISGGSLLRLRVDFTEFFDQAGQVGVASMTLYQSQCSAIKNNYDFAHITDSCLCRVQAVSHTMLWSSWQVGGLAFRI